MTRRLGTTLAIGALATVATIPPSEARLTRLVINTTEVVADGASFGSTGPYERLTGTAYFEVDPDDRRNAQVFDLDKADRNARGKVEFSADAVILKPADMRKANGRLYFEVNNRGNKISFQMMQDTPPGTPNNRPVTAADFGNGFLMRQGYVVAWVGWGGDIAPGGDRLTVNFPIAKRKSGEPITERILTEFSDRNFGGLTPFTLPLSGGAAFKSYAAVSTDKRIAEAELRRRPSDSPRPPSPRIPAGELVPGSEWSLARCPDGPGAATAVPSETDICLAGGFQNNMVYELRYRATSSPVMGLGYVTSRDFVSFLRYANRDDTGTPNPVRGLDTALCIGISSSGMYYRDYLYQGFNEDEHGRRACDGVHIHIPGVQKLFLNYRFAQPNPFTVQHRERYVPDTNFPRRYQLEHDPLAKHDRHDHDGGIDGILKRPKTDPKVIHTDTGTEWWQFRSSLVDTDDDGRRDLQHPSNVRRYLFSSTQHYPTKGGTPTFGTGNRMCEQLSNMTHSGVNARALLVALDEWVREGRRPPDSRIPRIKDGTLVPPDELKFPQIPGVTFLGLYNASGDRDFGPRVEGNRGVIDRLKPKVLSIHAVLVPKVDRFGNDAAGIRHPYVEAPIATLTGWNTRRPEFTAGDLCDLTGMTVALKRTAAERIAAGDPRPSQEELYGTHEGYVAAVRQAAERLKRARLMLQEDVDQTVAEAEASDVLK
ncbi:MAG TPA: alpha/beta hydrolase domain-containing protein [Burkholderiales bacterium]|nr:alpha/beta hydrolase domain-containing protein [Burkholderiales bacterium]